MLDARGITTDRDADRAQPVRVVGAGRGVDETSGRGAHLGEPELVHVARDRRLHDVVALLAERVDELGLGRDRAVADETEDRLLPHRVAHASTSRSMSSASSTSSAVTTSGGRSRSTSGSGREDEQAALAARVDHLARVAVEHGGEQQAAAAHGEGARERRQATRELRATSEDILEHRVVDRLDDRARGGGGDGVAAEGRAVVARPDRLRDALAHEQRADRQPVAETLRQRDEVGLDPELLVGEERPGAAEAGLHLVDREEGADLVRDLRRGPDEALLERLRRRPRRARARG